VNPAAGCGAPFLKTSVFSVPLWWIRGAYNPTTMPAPVGLFAEDFFAYLEDVDLAWARLDALGDLSSLWGQRRAILGKRTAGWSSIAPALGPLESPVTLYRRATWLKYSGRHGAYA